MIKSFINEFKTFAVNLDYKLSVIEIGPEKAKIAVVDDFYQNPMMVRELALTIPPSINERILNNLPYGIDSGRINAFYILDHLGPVYDKIIKEVFYEYYWENPFPQTPTQYAVRTNQYKFIRSHGVWDIDQLYDLKKDPYEMNNLIRDPELQDIAKNLNKKLWDWLDKTNGLYIPLKPITDKKGDHIFRNTW